MSTISIFSKGSQIYAHLYKSSAFTPDEIVDRAILAFTSCERGTYDELRNNCEHFATRIIRDESTSHQSTAILAGVKAGSAAGAAGAMGGVAAATAIGLSNVVIAETVAVPLWGSSVLGAMGLTQTTVLTSTVTAFEAGLVTTAAVGGMALAGALLASIYVGYSVFSAYKRSESYGRTTQLRMQAQSAGEKRLKALGFDCSAFNVAFCGGTGRGKSTCINALLGRDAALVSSSGEGTTEIRKYEVGMNAGNDARKLVLHDIPGAGTVNHPELTYWEDKQLACFEVLIVFLELGSVLDFERDLIQRAVSEKNPPLAIVFGQADRPIAKLTKRRVGRADAAARVRAEAAAALERHIKMHAGQSLPPLFLISQRQWCNKTCELDESELVAFLLRQTAQMDIPSDQINQILSASGMPPLRCDSEPLDGGKARIVSDAIISGGIVNTSEGGSGSSGGCSGGSRPTLEGVSHSANALPRLLWVEIPLVNASSVS
jgi:hypothetical protein